MRGWIRGSWSVIGASALHAAIIAAAWIFPVRSGPSRLPPVARLEPSIDILWEPSTPMNDRVTASRSEPSGKGVDSRIGMRIESSAARGRVLPGSSYSEMNGGEDFAADGGAEPSAEGSWSLSPARRHGRARASTSADLGIGPSLSWRLAPRLADRKDPAVRQAEESSGGVRDLLDAHDREIGLGRGGAIVSALETAANIDAAPLSGKASFEVTISSSGRVWVGVSRVDGAWPAWNKVAGELAAQLRNKTFRVPPGARGLRFQVDLDARVVEYDGSKAPAGTRLQASPGKIGDNGMYEKLPGVYLSGGGRICQYELGLVPVPQQPIGFGGWCDPTKAVVKPQRVVSARVVSEGRL